MAAFEALDELENALHDAQKVCQAFVLFHWVAACSQYIQGQRGAKLGIMMFLWQSQELHNAMHGVVHCLQNMQKRVNFLYFCVQSARQSPQRKLCGANDAIDVGYLFDDHKQ
jgi:hypothetical protein